MKEGRLVYLMGPSGAGKDSVLQGLRQNLPGCRLRIARRIITRSAEAVGEDAVGVSPQAFDDLESTGAFAMAWRANGLAYGIPREIDSWLLEGYQVVVNGSRGYLDEARRRYPTLLPILLEVEPAILRARLNARARESADQIEARLARSAAFTDNHALRGDPSIVRVDNSASLETTVKRLLDIIESHPANGA
ncbi:phosphonate metabolism protein/1,5-bisphosphokinase (PRPP-forming) PhnN [Pseudomonas sp. MGal98]|uniref:phosphonate metabolism protein/1,5-bisphosphokinase (PRPP-forming) PhnN n=1 Tax=Pseudomonas sp. MGal98 TaxID=3162460 RepID=UPI0032F007D4